MQECRKDGAQKMSISSTVNAMRKIVCVYDKIQSKKNKIKKKADKALSVMKGGNNMKFGTIIGIVIGAITLIAAGAAAMYVFLNGFPCCKKDCCEDGDLYDEFPEEAAPAEEAAPEEKAPAEESAE